MDASEFEVYDALKSMLEHGNMQNLHSLKTRLAGLAAELGDQNGLSLVLSSARNTLNEQRIAMERQMKASDSSMRSSYADAFNAAVNLDDRLTKTQGRLEVLKSRTARMGDSAAKWEEYLVKITPILGAESAMSGAIKMIKPACDTWVEDSLRGR